VKVLCAWEFGSDLGHVRRLIPIARELRAMGHSVSVAFRDGSRLDAAMSEGLEVFVAPLLRPPRMVSPAPVSYSDILLNLGFDDRASLAGTLRAWRSLYTLVQPDVVVADYAPTALVAARAHGVRRVTIGSGFALPRLANPLPAIRPWAPVDEAVLRALDDRVVNALRASFADAALAPRLAVETLDAQAHLLCTFPEIDPFGPRGDAEYIGPQNDSRSGADMHWNSAGATHVFAYLKHRAPRFTAILQGLAALDADVIVAAPGLDADEARRLSSASMRVIPGTVNIDLLIDDASLCVGHAGPGLTARALVAGVPMALLPTQVEQFLVAIRLVNAGSAELSSPEDPAPDYAAWFRTLLANSELRQRAARAAEAHRGYSFEAATRRAAQRIAEVGAG
jgi:UDP:flavonoid glycosyltransferase YjiC (YdhE family)